MDSREFAQNFLTAFDAHVINFNINTDAGIDSYATIMGGSVYAQNYSTGYTINVSCFMPTLPINNSLIGHFDIGGHEHRLIKVQTTTQADDPIGLVTHRIDLTYKTMDFDKFTVTLKNLAFERYGKKFHQQLEDILD